MTIAVYPGSFDPIHYGHVDIARRAARLFDKLIVGIYDHPQKRLLFSAEERVEMAREALADVANIEVTRYDMLTVQFVRACNARVVVRGLRVISDFELEYQMALTTAKLDPEVDMVCLMTGLDFAFLSSSIVKEVAMAGGHIEQFVPRHVAEAINAKVRAGA